MNRLPLSRRIQLLLLCLCWFLPGSLPAGTEEGVSKAQAHYDEGEYREAEIVLKDLLQSDPGVIDARLLLAKVYLGLGEGGAAAKEIRTAMKLGADSPELRLELADALLQQGQFREVLDELAPADFPDAQQAAVLGMRGRALIGLGDLDEARAAFAKAGELDPNDRLAGLGEAQLAMLDGDSSTAALAMDRLLELYPEDVDLMLVRAEAYRQQRDDDAALAQFSEILALEPENLQALLGRATVLVGKRRFDDARAELDRVEEMRPSLIVAAYLRAVMSFYDRDWDKAANYVGQVLSVQPQHLKSMLLMGFISYARSDLQIADEYLSRVREAQPQDTRVAKVLAATRLKLGDPRGAADALEPFAADGDSQIMALLGSAYMLDGDMERGQDWLMRAVEAAPDVAALRTQLALSLIAGGRVGDAITELSAAVDLGQDVMQADVLLVLALLKEGKYDEAIDAGQSLEVRRPDNPIPYNLTGLAYLAEGQLSDARARFEKALEIDSSFTTALINLARVDVAEEDTAAAARRYTQVLDQDPKNLAALLGMAGLAERREDTEGLVQWLNRAQDANPGAVQPGLLLTRFNLDRREYLKALTIASDLAARFPDNTEVLELLGRAQTLSGEASSAVRTFEQLLKQRPEDPRIHYLLGGAEWKTGDRAAAARSFRRATQLQPEYIDARVALLSVLADDQRYDDAIDVARRIQEDYPRSPVGWRLEGRLQVQARNLDAAVKPLQEAQSLAPDTATVLDLASVHNSSGETDKAIELLQEWTAAYPDDGPSLTRLAMYLQSEGRDDEALPIYQHLYELDQANVVVLNNLAWIYHERNDVRALEIARQAYERAPTRPEVADTYGWVLYNRGSKTQGLNMLQEAHLAYPTQTEIAYHVAVALDGVGRGDEAVNILRKLLRDYPNAAEADKARVLMEKLSGGGAG